MQNIENARLLERMNYPLAESFLLRARTLLEAALPSAPKDVRLRFDYGEVLELLRRHADAKRVLDDVLSDAPDHPLADGGWWRLAEACGHLGDHPCEKRAYTEVLKRWTEDGRRATPLLNLAETEMHLGNLREAIDTYRECIRVAGRVGARETPVLAQWGLAVALDRAGDNVAALREATFAAELERSGGFLSRYVPHPVSSLLRSPGVYFVPDYEVTWYEGLGAMALAKKAANDPEALAYWTKAEQSFTTYVRGAERDQTNLERWTAIAKNRLAAAAAERAKVEKRVRARPPPAVNVEETP
jgi:tetratricopeptide (TPR) repeat protein